MDFIVYTHESKLNGTNSNNKRSINGITLCFSKSKTKPRQNKKREKETL